MKKKMVKKSVSKTKKAAQRSGVTPVGDRVLVRPSKEEEKRIGALIIPATGEREKPDTGVVLAVGEGKYVDGKLVPVQVRVGDTVMFSKYGYDELKVGGEELYILKEDSILAIIN